MHVVVGNPLSKSRQSCAGSGASRGGMLFGKSVRKSLGFWQPGSLVQSGKACWGGGGQGRKLQAEGRLRGDFHAVLGVDGCARMSSEKARASRDQGQLTGGHRQKILMGTKLEPQGGFGFGLVPPLRAPLAVEAERKWNRTRAGKELTRNPTESK